MPRLGIFTSQVILTGPPLEATVYRVPLNPTEITAFDSAGAEWQGGLNIGGRYERYHDNRERKLVWKNLPSYDGYVTMLHHFENWTGLDYVHFDLGNSLLPGLYATGADWKRISITKVETGDINGNETKYSGGEAYDVWSTLTVYFEILGDI